MKFSLARLSTFLLDLFLTFLFFIFVGTALFFIIKGIEKAQKLTGIKEEKTAEKKPTELEVLQEIKALLEKK
ncbi:large conductance mechanosensitive channel protein [Streptococcus pneumoniae]|nr:large conductance mechanosensitive channel protein [Streptococcus pneumoniae]